MSDNIPPSQTENNAATSSNPFAAAIRPITPPIPSTNNNNENSSSTQEQQQQQSSSENQSHTISPNTPHPQNNTTTNTTTANDDNNPQAPSVQSSIRVSFRMNPTNSNNDTSTTTSTTPPNNNNNNNNNNTTTNSTNNGNSNNMNGFDAQHAAAHAAAHAALNHPAVRDSIARHARRAQQQRQISSNSSPPPTNTNTDDDDVEGHTRQENTTTTTPLPFPPPGAIHVHHHHGPPPPGIFGPPPPGWTGPVPVPPGMMFPNMNGMTNGGSGNGMSMASLPPLTPQPVPIPPGKTLRRCEMRRREFECAICFDYMENPSGCGHCPSRFCHSCLSRVVHDATHPPSHPTNTPQCPCCRHPFRAPVPDPILLKKMSVEELILCPYPGCNEELSIINAKAHEARCPYLVIKCQYVAFGCTWIGPTKDYDGHLTHSCHCERVKGLVESHRHLRAVHQQKIHQLSHQTAVAHRMIQAQGNMLVDLQMKMSDDLCCYGEFVYQATLFPLRFVLNKDVWRHFVGVPARVYNVLYVGPSLLLFLRTFLTGLRHTIRPLPPSTTNLDAIDGILLSITSLAIITTTILSFLVDKGSPTAWTPRRFILTHDNNNASSSPSAAYPLFRDVVGISLAAGYFFSLFLAEENIPAAIVLGISLSVSSIMLPPFLQPLIRMTAGLSNDDDDDDANDTADESPSEGHVRLSKGRPVVHFGLRFGLATSMVGWMPLFDGFVFHMVEADVFCAVAPLRDVGTWLKEVHTSNNGALAETVSSRTYWGIFLARIVYFYVVGGRKAVVKVFLKQAVLGTLVLVVTSYVMEVLEKVALVMGYRVLEKTSDMLRRGAEGETEASVGGKTVEGYVAFGLWVCCLGSFFVV